MKLEVGMIVASEDVYGEPCQGRVECFGVHTVILSNGVHRHVLNKKSLAKQGYTLSNV